MGRNNIRNKNKYAHLVECRACSRMFKKIKGIKQYDNNCCSEKCFLVAGTMPKQEEVRQVKEQETVQAVNVTFKATRATKSGKVQKRRRRRVGKEAFFHSPEWVDLRFKVLKQYGRCCMLCGETSGVIQVDHIKPRSKYPELALAFSNMQVLCKACNHGKSNTDETDFRPKSQNLPYGKD